MGVAKCRACDAPVVWVETEASAKKPARKMPLDADADGHALRLTDGTGNIVFTGQETGDGTPIVRVLPKGKGNRRSHFATCPNADRFRKPKINGSARR